MSSFQIRAFLSGQDNAFDDYAARQMANLSYILRDAGEALLVDPTWGPGDLVDACREDDLRITGVLVTHAHADHVGGALWGTRIAGIAELMKLAPCPVHVHRAEVAAVRSLTGIRVDQVVSHEDGDLIPLGNVSVKLVHTPGHSPGSSCFFVEDHLLTGDTLFCQECGRVDLPGSSPEEMIRTLGQRLAGIPDDVHVWPGHDYGGKTATLGHLRRTNVCLLERDPARLMGLIL